MQRTPLPVFLAATVLSSILAIAQEGHQPLSMDKVMTSQERRQTGVSSLTSSQRIALDRWLNTYTLRVIETARTVLKAPDVGEHATAVYHSPGSGHWIRENGDGKIITLEDGSLWQVSDLDQIDTALWLPTTNITILRSSKAVGEFKYVLVNTEDGEKASAKYLGNE